MQVWIEFGIFGAFRSQQMKISNLYFQSNVVIAIWMHCSSVLFLSSLCVRYYLDRHRFMTRILQSILKIMVPAVLLSKYDMRKSFGSSCENRCLTEKDCVVVFVICVSLLIPQCNYITSFRITDEFNHAKSHLVYIWYSDFICTVHCAIKHR